jgi:hypothetical protein
MLYLVRTITTFRHLYALEADSIEDAKALVQGGNVEEVGQEFLTETVVRIEKSSKEEYLKQFDMINDYLKNWSEEKKLSFIHMKDKVLNDP